MMEEVSLRPISLRPAEPGGNPFQKFGKGAGFGIKAAKQSVVETPEDLEAKAKRNENRVVYSTEFLMQFMERYNTCPPELSQLNLDIVITLQEEKEQQRIVLQKVVEELDDRDWRTRTPLAAETSPQPQGFDREPVKQDGPAGRSENEAAPATREKLNLDKPTRQPVAAAAVESGANAGGGGGGADMLKIVRAADSGKEAYKVGASISQEDRAVRQVKGILNKLAPEKFERLLEQMLGIITTADILRHTIAMVFENAVAQPTFVAMYAELCVQLSKELPQFPPPEGADRPLAFRQILLNTCQDEFEGAEQARLALASVDPSEKDLAAKRVKDRTMGTVRLIAELYKRDMVKDWIVSACMDELLGRNKGAKVLPPEDNIEAACEILTLAGIKLCKAERVDVRKKIEDCLKVLERFGSDRNLSARIRFVIKDLMDLRKSNWVPRREAFTAKKLDEVRAQAEAELGLISSNIVSALPALPALATASAEDFLLLPPLRSGDDSWTQRPQGTGARADGGSALIGDYVPPPVRQVAAPVVVAAVAKPVVVKAAQDLSEEELAAKTENLLAEYETTGDANEALTCVRELSSPGWMPQLVKIVLDRMLNALKDREQELMATLLLHLLTKEAISTADLVSGLGELTGQLEDLALDIPKAPFLIGTFYGRAVAQNVLALDLLPDMLASESGMEPKRQLAAALFKTIKEKAGEASLGPLCDRAGIKASAILSHDPEFDGEMASVQDWLKAEGLAGVPL